MNIYKLRNVLKITFAFFKQYRKKLALLSVLGFAAGLFGGIGVGAIIPLFAMATGQSEPGTDFISKIVQRVFTTLHLPYNIFLLLLFMVVLFAAKALVTFLANYISIKTSVEYEKGMMQKLFKRTMTTSWPYLLEQKPGYMDRILLNDIVSTSTILSYLGGIILVLTSLITYATIAINISAPITLITFLIGGGLFFFFKPWFYKSRRLTEKSAVETKKTAHHLHDSLAGSKTIKANAVENKVIQIANEYFENLRLAKIKLAFNQSFIGSVMEPVGFGFVAILFLFSYKSPNLNIAAFAAIVYLIQKIFSFIQNIQSRLHDLSAAIPYLNIVLDYKEGVEANQETDNGKDGFEFKNSLNFDKVDFNYEKQDFSLLNISFSVKKGEMVGLIGPSGAGKTTLVDLMLRFFVPKKGEIKLDNKNIQEIRLEEWRKNIGYVSQDIFLLNETIEDNIRFFNESITREEIFEMAKMANIYDFIESLPDKWQTMVGERGVKLSVGQRQRIILTRTLVRKPKILILDEATSALDNESEQLIQESIKKLRGKITLIVIAHRLPTIISSDRLIVIENGKLIEEGTPQDLLNNKDSYFYKVYNIS